MNEETQTVSKAYLADVYCSHSREKWVWYSYVSVKLFKTRLHCCRHIADSLHTLLAIIVTFLRREHKTNAWKFLLQLFWVIAEDPYKSVAKMVSLSMAVYPLRAYLTLRTISCTTVVETLSPLLVGTAQKDATRIRRIALKYFWIIQSVSCHRRCFAFTLEQLSET